MDFFFLELAWYEAAWPMIADGCRMKKYKQVFSENMGKKSVPHITDCNQGENWTMITFKPDLARFNMTYLEEDHVTLMWKRVVDMAGLIGDSVRVEWDGVRLLIDNFDDYVRLYIIPLSVTDQEQGFQEFTRS